MTSPQNALGDVDRTPVRKDIDPFRYEIGILASDVAYSTTLTGPVTATSSSRKSDV